MTVRGENYVSSVKLSDSVADLVEVPRYSDQPIFNVDDENMSQ